MTRPPSGRCRRRSAFRPAHRGGPYLLLRHEVLRADGREGDGSRRRGASGADGILRHRPTRVVASIIEASHDEAGDHLAESVAPFHVALLNLKAGDSAVDAACGQLYGALEKAGFEVLYDDRDERPGAKFATADLIAYLIRSSSGRRASPRARRRSSGARPGARRAWRSPTWSRGCGRDRAVQPSPPKHSRASSACWRCAISAPPKEGFIPSSRLLLRRHPAGVAALIIVMSVMNGFRKELISKILGISAMSSCRRWTRR